jgi:ribosomal protein S18 acetylase RimI-like enzyme
VLPQFRSQGVGLQLVNFVIERARSRGAAAIGLHTNENNEGAQAFYRRVGFLPRTEVAWKEGREVYWGLRL